MTPEHLTELLDAFQSIIRGSQDMGRSMKDIITLVQDNAERFDDPEVLLAALNQVLDASKAMVLKNKDATETIRKIKKAYL